MTHRHAINATHDVFALAASTWLACGIVLLGLTPLPLHDADWGWSPLFWLLLAPAIMLGARHVFTRKLSVHATQASHRVRGPMTRRRTVTETVTPLRTRSGNRRHAARRSRLAG